MKIRITCFLLVFFAFHARAQDDRRISDGRLSGGRMASRMTSERLDAAEDVEEAMKDEKIGEVVKVKAAGTTPTARVRRESFSETKKKKVAAAQQ